MDKQKIVLTKKHIKLQKLLSWDKILNAIFCNSNSDRIIEHINFQAIKKQLGFENSKKENK